MLKFSELNEAKKFYPDARIIKLYASFIIPLYINGDLKCEQRMLDEWLEMNKSREKFKNEDMVCDLEILAVRQVIENPLSQSGYNLLRLDINNKCPKLERFLRKYFQKKLNIIP